VVGSERVDGIEELTRTHQKFTAESKIPSGWRMKDVFVIGWDGAGNPFGIDLKTGRLRSANLVRDGAPARPQRPHPAAHGFERRTTPNSR